MTVFYTDLNNSILLYAVMLHIWYVCVTLFLFYYLMSYYEHLHIATEKEQKDNTNILLKLESSWPCMVVSLIEKGCSNF